MLKENCRPVKFMKFSPNMMMEEDVVCKFCGKVVPIRKKMIYLLSGVELVLFMNIIGGYVDRSLNIFIKILIDILVIVLCYFFVVKPTFYMIYLASFWRAIGAQIQCNK